MTVQLYSIEHAPPTVPAWPAILEDLCQPPAERVARVLGLSVRTVRRYNRTGIAPRHVCLALFWLTNWGRSAVYCQATNDARLAVGYVDALQRRIRALEGTVAHLQLLNDSGAANDPIELVSHALQRLAPALPTLPPQRRLSTRGPQHDDQTP